ncbi:MAG: hypothetical protein C0514_08555 [Candidatus Puniceispirillum sp.]|nr:hypothetical protein [Candidatus Puniceispirillum sp.]
MTRFLRRMLLCMGVAFLVLSSHLLASDALDTPYVISDVKVDISAADATQARLKAVEEAQSTALARLAETDAVAPEVKAKLTGLKASDIDKLVKDIEITQEKFTSTRYMATFTIAFKEAEFQKLMTGGDDDDVAALPLPAQEAPLEPTTPVLPARELTSRPAVVVPLFLAQGQMLLWEEDNPWLHTLAADTHLSPLLILPAGDLTDMDALDLAGARKPSAQGLYALRTHYEAPFVVVAAFEEDASGTTVLNLALFDEQRLIAQDTKTLPTGKDTAASMQAAIPLLTAFVQNPPALSSKTPETLPIPPQDKEGLVVGVSFPDLATWMGIKQRLETFPGVGTVTVKALSKTRATLLVKPTANKNALARALTNGGFVVDRQNALAPAGDNDELRQSD